MSSAELGSRLLGDQQLQESNYNICHRYYENHKNYTDPVDVGTSVVTIISCCFSILGSLLIIVTFIAFREIRTIGRAILVFLAVADFFTAAGYIFGSGVFLKYHPNFLDHNNLTTSYTHLCKAQSFITTAFPISSFLWTTNLAVYLFVAIVLRKLQWAKRLLIVFHITAWGIPLLICIPALATGWLGPAQSRSSASWCWVKYDPERSDKLFHFMEFVCGKFWEIMAYFVALLLCGIVKYTIFKRGRRAMTETPTTYGFSSIEKKMKAAFYNVDQKLIWIPVVFFLVRIWGTLRFFMSLHPTCHYRCNGIPVMLPECERVLYNPALVYLQSIGDPGQGWSNALLYVVFHQPIASRLFPCCFVCWKSCSRWLRRHLVICKVRRKVVNDSPPSSTAHCTPDNSAGSHYNDQDPLIKKKSGSTTSYDTNSVLYQSADGGQPKAIVVLADGDNVSINEPLDSTNNM